MFCFSAEQLGKDWIFVVFVIVDVCLYVFGGVCVCVCVSHIRRSNLKI